MQLPRTEPWLAGSTQPSEVEFNELEYAFQFLLRPPQCIIYQTTVQNIASGASVAATNMTALVDTESEVSSGVTKMWDSVNNNRITVQTPGWYEVEYATAWITGGGGDRRARWVSINNSGFAGEYDEIASAAIPNEGRNMIEWFFNTGDYMTLGLTQASGSARDTQVTGFPWNRRCYLRAKWVSL